MHSVVAVHGLNGDPFKTWTTEGSEKMWLKDPDLLPSNLKNSRILTYGYNAMVTAVLGKTSSDRILQHAQTLVAELVADREVSLLSRMKSAIVTEIEQVDGRCDAAAHHLHLPLAWWYYRETSMLSRASRKPRFDYDRHWRIPQAEPANSSNTYIRSTSRHLRFCSWARLMTVAKKRTLLPSRVA